MSTEWQCIGIGKKVRAKWSPSSLGCHHARGAGWRSKGSRVLACTEDFISLSTVMSLECPRSRSATGDRRVGTMVSQALSATIASHGAAQHRELFKHIANLHLYIAIGDIPISHDYFARVINTPMSFYKLRMAGIFHVFFFGSLGSEFLIINRW